MKTTQLSDFCYVTDYDDKLIVDAKGNTKCPCCKDSFELTQIIHTEDWIANVVYKVKGN